MRHNINEVSEHPLAGIEERINSMEFSMLNPSVQVYQTGPRTARIVCEQDLFVCDIEVKDFVNKIIDYVGYTLRYKPYINGVAEEEYISHCVTGNVWTDADYVAEFISDSKVMNNLNPKIKHDITRFAYSYYEMYRSKIEAAVKLKRLTEISNRARTNFAPDVEPIKRREM